MRIPRLFVATAALILGATARAEAPECDPGPVLPLDALGTPEDDLARLAELAGQAPADPGMIRRGGHRLRSLCDAHATLGWLSRAATPPPPDAFLAVLSPRIESTLNTTYPSGRNDGLLWAGRGLSALARVGVAARWGALSASLAPEVAWSQNRWFETVPTGGSGNLAFANPWYGANLDLPQRFGAGPFATATLGQSYLRADALGAAIGVSTENLWLGPGTSYSLLMSNAGPGFPHAFIGTSAPVDVGIGRVEALALFGRLDRSRELADGGHPAITALAVDYAPRWVSGLTLGAGRVFVETWGSLREDSFLSIVRPPISGSHGAADDQLAALWFRWVMPESEFELYGEWGRDDMPASFAGLVREPERTQGWVAGFQKLLPAGTRRVRVKVELARLHEVRPLGAAAGLPIWYTHSDDLGYANGGQPIGAFIGPGSDAQRLAIDVIGSGGRIGGYVERIRRNEEVFWSLIEPQGRDSQHDTELFAAVRQVLFAGPLEIAWEAGFGYRWNRDFLRNEPNARIVIEITSPAAQWLDRARPFT